MITGGSELLEGTGCIFTKGSHLSILLSGAWEEQVGQVNSILVQLSMEHKGGQCQMQNLPGHTRQDYFFLRAFSPHHSFHMYWAF